MDALQLTGAPDFHRLHTYPFQYTHMQAERSLHCQNRLLYTVDGWEYFMLPCEAIHQR